MQGFFTAMTIRDYLTRNRSAPSSPKVRVSGGKGSDAGAVRNELYKAAWVRYNEAMSAGFYLEAITIVDSLITDRIEAYTQHLMHFEDKHQQVESLGNAMAALNIARQDRQIADDDEYKAIRKAVMKFNEGRNKAVHNFVILSNANAEMSVDDRINQSKNTAEYGREVFNLVNAYTRKQMYGGKK